MKINLFTFYFIAYANSQRFDRHIGSCNNSPSNDGSDQSRTNWAQLSLVDAILPQPLIDLHIDDVAEKDLR